MIRIMIRIASNEASSLYNDFRGSKDIPHNINNNGQRLRISLQLNQITSSFLRIYIPPKRMRNTPQNIFLYFMF
jgi:hypothetical protein